MDIVRSLEEKITLRWMPALLYLAGLLAVLTTKIRLTDYTHEIQVVGDAWFRGGSIPLVQAYSSFGPVLLYLGAQYERYLETRWSQLIFEAVVFSFIALLFFAVTRMHAKAMFERNCVLLFGLFIVTIPGVWQYGVNPMKFGLLFVLSTMYFHDKWLSSGPSYWFGGKTAHNWRFLLLAGVSLSLVVYTSLLYALFALPIIIRHFRVTTQRKTFVSSTALILAPLFAQTWLWFSYFSSRGLTHQSSDAMGINFRFLLELDNNFSTNSVLFLPIIGLAVLAVKSVHAKNYKTNTELCITSLLALAILALALRNSAVLILPAVLVMSVRIFKSQRLVAGIVMLSTAGLLLSVPYRMQIDRKADLHSAQTQLVRTYIEQRFEEPHTVFYYGKGAGFYKKAKVTGSTRYYEASLISWYPDRFLDTFRGDNEANTPKLIILAINEETRLEAPERLSQYFKIHYEKLIDLDGYSVLQRK